MVLLLVVLNVCIIYPCAHEGSISTLLAHLMSHKCTAMSTDRLNKFSKMQEGTRTKNEISDEDLDYIMKKWMPDPSKNLTQWMETTLDDFIDHYVNFLVAMAKKTYRTSKPQLKARLLDAWAIEPIHADMFAIKVCQAFQKTWASAKNASNGAKLIPAKMAIIDAWTDKRDPTVKTEPLAKIAKLEAVKMEPLAKKVKAEPKDEDLHPVNPLLFSPLKPSCEFWDSPVKSASASKSAEWSPKVVWGNVKKELVPDPPSLASSSKVSKKVAYMHHSFNE